MTEVEGIATIALTLLAAVVSALIRRSASSRFKTLTLTLPDSQKEEEISVPATASTSDIALSVRDALELEDAVDKALRTIVEPNGTIRRATQRGPDFVMEWGGHRYAIEVKYKLRNVRRNDVVDYADSVERVEKLFLVSPQLPSSSLRDSVADLLTSNRLEFVELASDKTILEILQNVFRNPVTPTRQAKAYHPA